MGQEREWGPGGEREKGEAIEGGSARRQAPGWRVPALLHCTHHNPQHVTFRVMSGGAGK